MLTVFNCITQAHDLRLVGLAAIICAIASLTAINLLRHARHMTGWTQIVWLIVTAISTGFGIWATHFVGMLAFEPGMSNGYNVVLTFVSLIAAILLTGAGLAVALLPNRQLAPCFGGVIVAGGIAAMHYTGMAAFELQATIHWDITLVVASIVVGAAFGAIALPVSLHGETAAWTIGGALLLTLAICGHHFTAMSAASIVPDPTIMVSPLTIPAGWLALGVALVSLVIIGIAIAGIMLDLRDHRRTAVEADRMLGLANAAVEGLLVCDGETIVTVNASFATLAAVASDRLVGTRLTDWFSDAAAMADLTAHPSKSVEANLCPGAGDAIPVELILRGIDFAGRPHQVIAVRDLRKRNQAEQHIRFLAHHDALTSLPNRGTFHERVRQQIAVHGKGRSLAVLSLDLDHFKQINDLSGHAAGDTVLKNFSACISELLSEGQMLARLGGDEFAIMLPNLSNHAEAGQFGDRILETFRAKNPAFDLADIGASIGIALYPDDASDFDTLLARADIALYSAKADGGAAWRFFEPGMGEAVRDRRMLEHDLRYAVCDRQLSLVYQPQEAMHCGEVIGFEALLRWNHPQRGNVRPDIFIPIAEETGTILEIGEWVLRQACTEAASWARPLTIAVNVSAVQIYHENFVALVHGILLETGLPAHRLELEITETALVRDFNRALAALRRIKALGVHIAMDDFGTGYSSLSNLRAFPFDKIKIDRSFVTSVNSNSQAAAIVRAVLGLGRGLGLPVLAEGVETEAEFQFLRDEQCDEAQGYLLGRPAPISHFASITHGTPAPVPVRAPVPALAASA